jgi:hypothetical protein
MLTAIGGESLAEIALPTKGETMEVNDIAHVFSPRRIRTLSVCIKRNYCRPGQVSEARAEPGPIATVVDRCRRSLNP